MLSIRTYTRPATLEDAYALAQKRPNVVLGGMGWLAMEHRNIATAIDLSDLGLDQIEETEDAYRIGAMVPLRTLELHAGLNAMTHGAIAESLKGIVGVQFRNSATVGGSVYARFGFSDVSAILMALDAKVELYKAGILTMGEFAAKPRTERDILVSVIVPKGARRICYLAQRNTKTDIPVLTCAVVADAKGVRAVVGACPRNPEIYGDEGLLSGGITEEAAAAFGEQVAQRAVFGTNTRGSAAYRKKIAAVLVRRAALALNEQEG